MEPLKFIYKFPGHAEINGFSLELWTLKHAISRGFLPFSASVSNGNIKQTAELQVSSFPGSLRILELIWVGKT